MTFSVGPSRSESKMNASAQPSRAQAGDEAEDQVLDGAPVVEQALVRFVVHGVSVDGGAVPAAVTVC